MVGVGVVAEAATLDADSGPIVVWRCVATLDAWTHLLAVWSLPWRVSGWVVMQLRFCLVLGRVLLQMVVVVALDGGGVAVRSRVVRRCGSGYIG